MLFYKLLFSYYGSVPEAHITSIIQLKQSISKATVRHVILSNSRLCEILTETV